MLGGLQEAQLVLEKKETTNIVTLGDAKRTTMLSKGPWVLDTFLGNTINTRKKE